MSPDPEDDLETARDLLRALIQAQGYNLQALDAKLAFARGHVSRLLTGATRLTYGQILEILRAIEVEPSLFFSTLHPYPQQAPPTGVEPAVIEDLRAVLERLLPSPAPSHVAPLPVSTEDVQARIDAAVRAVRRQRTGKLAGASQQES
jgi:hypothetical protein